MKYDGYWLSPNDKIIPINRAEIGGHIESIINNPEKFGLTSEYINKIFKKHKEKIGRDGNARDEIISKLIESGWVRISYTSRQDFFIVQIGKLTKNLKELIWDWAVAATRKIDKISEFTGVKIADLTGNIFFDGNIRDIVSYQAFQENVKYSYKNKICLFNDYEPTLINFIMLREGEKNA